MSNKKESAYGAPSAGTDFRKTWDKAEYEAKAKKRDEEERERMKEADEALQKAKQHNDRSREFARSRCPRILLRRVQQNFQRLVILPRPSKFLISSVPSFGFTTQVARSTIDQVRAKIAEMREATKLQAASKQYDFTQRLKEIKAAEEAEREAKRLKKLQAREAQAKAKPPPGVYQPAESTETTGENGGDEMAKLMGFSGGFKSRK
ncbi:hypothetical protein PTTG_05244 [Puccinia triticina 1-1 BBBD Race 1]|uniref:Uncharacterized protein n=1 Tax=Puccinia triticina (isolate 1-1 / race 1 (BBBD)) TaxID=630390 RepID=A0A180GAU9_PUCT1|nr:hypothetical protein PTTG_05244 [Puccinia triticina 1-1 BBBD Race 1]WAR53505.1 hypothetical protein PtB15_3B13 [Puccinia triticina]